jgi:hypothetical protein
MKDKHDVARQVLVESILLASTADEIRAARESLSSWLADHPDDRPSLTDGYAYLANLEEATYAGSEKPLVA